MSDAQKYSSKLQGSRILIIGGTSGIGFCVAEACLESGALVTISSSNPDRISSAISRLKTSYPSASSKIKGVPCDLSHADTLEDSLEKLLQESVKGTEDGKLDHVVYTAGDALSLMKLSDLSMARILQAGQLRFFAPLLLAKFLPRYVVPSRKSSYTITTGVISEKPNQDWTVVASYAGGLHSMVRNLAVDLKPLRVNGVSPGVVDTELWKMGKEEKDKFLKMLGDKLPTGVPGDPSDVAESYLAILKDANMDGSMLRTDGGGMLV